MRLPGRSEFPPLDERLVEPETRDEIIGGRRVVACPADAPHAQHHHRLDYVLGAAVAPGYLGATDQLTRHDRDSDFASDVCLYRAGVDPSTGGRYLEELAFEVVAQQSEKAITEKAVHMHERGVRRIFALFVEAQQVAEWSVQTRSWQPLTRGSQITDRCLASPVSVEALLEAAAADRAVVEALKAKGNPEIQRLEAAGEARGKAGSLLEVLAARGLAVTPDERSQMLACQDLPRLAGWLRRALSASTVAEVLAEP